MNAAFVQACPRKQTKRADGDADFSWLILGNSCFKLPLCAVYLEKRKVGYDECSEYAGGLELGLVIGKQVWSRPSHPLNAMSRNNV